MVLQFQTGLLRNSYMILLHIPTKNDSAVGVKYSTQCYFF